MISKWNDTDSYHTHSGRCFLFLSEDIFRNEKSVCSTGEISSRIEWLSYLQSTSMRYYFIDRIINHLSVRNPGEEPLISSTACRSKSPIVNTRNRLRACEWGLLSCCGIVNLPTKTMGIRNLFAYLICAHLQPLSILIFPLIDNRFCRNIINKGQKRRWDVSIRGSRPWFSAQMRCRQNSFANSYKWKLTGSKKSIRLCYSLIKYCRFTLFHLLLQLNQKNPKLGKSYLWEQWSLLHLYTPSPDPNTDLRTALAATNAHRNRFPKTYDLLPIDRWRPRFRAALNTPEWTGYINAVCIDGTSLRDDVILTQTPFSHTMDEFWLLVDEEKVSAFDIPNVPFYFAF